MSTTKVTTDLINTLDASKLTGTLPAISGASLTNLPTTDLTSLQTNLATNFFLDAVNHARGVQNLSDGFVDQFEDQLGVDDPNSTGETYDATGDYYKNYNIGGYETGDRTSSTTVSTDLTLTGGTISNAIDGAITSGNTNDSFYFASQTVAGLEIKFDFGVSANKIINEAKWYQSATYSHGSWKWQGSDDDATWTDIGSTFSLGGGVLTQTQTELNGNTTGYRYYRLLGVSGTVETNWIHEIQFKVKDTVNMTLISESSTALTAPDTAQVTLFKEDVDAVTLNTDLLAWASRSKKTITATNATNVLNATAHGLSNNNRVMVTTSGGTTPMVLFDGSNDYLSGTVSSTGPADGKAYTFSFWYKPIGADSVTRDIFMNDNSRFFCRIEADNTMVFKLRNGSGTNTYVGVTTNTFLVAEGLRHVVLSVDLLNTTVFCYVDGVAETMTGVTGPINDTIDTGTTLGIGSVPGGSTKIHGELGQFYIAEEYINISDSAILAKFVTGTGASAKAVDFGADGSTPTGTQPKIFLNNTTSTWQNNLGSGGNFTEVGALTDGTDLVSALPNGLSQETAYHVVNKTADTFQVSATSGGSAVTFSDDGTGTHTSYAVTAATLVAESTIAPYDIVSASVDVSGQPSDTDMTLFVQSKNNKDFNLHGQSLQWS